MSSATIEAPAEFAVMDIFGKPIAVKDTIVYATRRGSSTYLNKLSVTEVAGCGGGHIKGFNPDDVSRRIRSITNFDTIAKVS